MTATTPAPISLEWYGLPCLGMRLSGDLVLADESEPGQPRAVVVDVGGHGPAAHALAERIRAAQPLGPPVADCAEVIRRIHLSLEGTGGIAAAMALRVLWSAGRCSVEYCGVGNVRIAFSGPAPRDEGRPGTIGQLLPTLRSHEVALEEGGMVAVFTDGLASDLSLGGELSRLAVRQVPPLLLRRHGRRHDDATCLVLRREVP